MDARMVNEMETGVVPRLTLSGLCYRIRELLIQSHSKARDLNLTPRPSPNR